MRGKVQSITQCSELFGITPAYAGKSNQKDLEQRQDIGSPPPMRGKDIAVLIGSNFIRITPAYAGKSRFWMDLQKSM